MDNKTLDAKIDKWWCSQFTDYKMKRIPGHKFVPEPAYLDENFKQCKNGKTKINYELNLDWKTDADTIEWDGDTIRSFAQYFYNLSKNRGQTIQVLF